MPSVVPEPFIQVVLEADVKGEFLNSSTVDALKNLVEDEDKRFNAVIYISEHASSIVGKAAMDLFAEQPQLISPGGNAYTSRRTAACLRDMEILLRYITYSMFTGNASILDDRCLNGLKETYLTLGVPLAATALSILKMRDVVIKGLTSYNSYSTKLDTKEELTISEIRRRYPKQWVTVEVTQAKDGFPAAGRVLAYNHDAAELANEICNLSGDKIYTFFSNRIDERPEPLLEDSRNGTILTAQDRALLDEIASYFNLSAASIS